MRRIVVIGLLLAVPVLTGSVVLGGPAQAVACSGSSGVTVVARFPDGHTETRCAPGDPTSGFDALKKAGFTATPVLRFPQALCQIDHLPKTDCTNMPPADAYWAYFHARPGGSWEYSNAGPGSYDPKPGTVEGWRFGGGDQWAGSAPIGAAPTPTPKPVSKPVPTKRPAAPRPTATATPTTAPSPTGSPSRTATATPVASASTVAAPSSPPVASPSAAAADQPTAALAPAGSSGISWIWGVVLVALLGVVGAAVALRRRS